MRGGHPEHGFAAKWESCEVGERFFAEIPEHLFTVRQITLKFR